jgi:hypothetical protein
MPVPVPDGRLPTFGCATGATFDTSETAFFALKDYFAAWLPGPCSLCGGCIVSIQHIQHIQHIQNIQNIRAIQAIQDILCIQNIVHIFLIREDVALL